MRECADRMHKPLTGLTSTAERVLLNARWDGNVRELKNVIERACMLTDGSTLSERELAGAFGPETPGAAAAPPQRRSRSSAARTRRPRSTRSNAITFSMCSNR